MHDLNVINRINAEAFAESIANYRKQGRWVLAKYEGLHLVSIETFTEQQPAQVAFDVEVSAQHGGSRAVLFTPVPVASDEYRAKFPADVTLSDYINRKTI